MTNTVLRAVENARRKYSLYDWLSMRPQERTAVIYEEVRRLDAETIALVTKDIAPQPRESLLAPSH